MTKCLTDIGVPKLLNESALLWVTPNGKIMENEHNDVKPCTTLELVEMSETHF